MIGVAGTLFQVVVAAVTSSATLTRISSGVGLRPAAKKVESLSHAATFAALGSVAEKHMSDTQWSNVFNLLAELR